MIRTGSKSSALMALGCGHDQISERRNLFRNSQPMSKTPTLHTALDKMNQERVRGTQMKGQQPLGIRVDRVWHSLDFLGVYG